MTDFDQMVSLIREKLKIHHYKLTDFLGYHQDFDLGERENYHSIYEVNLPASIDTFETGISAIEVSKWNLLSHVEENWKNLSLLKTVVENKSFSEHTWLDLSAQNLPSMDESGEPLFPYYEKEEFQDLVDPEKDIGWFLFIPNAVRNNLTPNNLDKLINQQGIHFPNTHFAIFNVWFNLNLKEWRYGGWYFSTPAEISGDRQALDMWGSIRFPFNDFEWGGAWIDDDPDGEARWVHGAEFDVGGGGFYLGNNAEILLDLQPLTPDKPLGILNWWASLQE